MGNDEVGTAVVPYEETPEIIEGEFVVKEEIPYVSPEERERVEKEAEKQRERLEDETERDEERKRRKEIRDIREEARARRGLPPEPHPAVKAADTLYKIGTLGGTPKVVRKELYIGKPAPGMYIPTGMRRLTTPFTKSPAKEALMPGREMPAGRALAPGLEKLRAKGELKAEPTELDLSQLRGGLTISNLQMDQKPRGWSETEWLVFREIRSNHDIDTVEHVAEEVAKFGGGKGAVKTAIRNLIKRGVVYEDRSFPGEPVLRVIPRR